MAHTFTFTVKIELEREQGKFASRYDMAEAIKDELESADPGGYYGLGTDGASDYTVTSWEVDES